MITPASAPARLRALLATGAVVGATALLGACGADDAPSASATSTGPTATASTSADGAALTVSDAWVKAVDSGMTAAFGVISNPTDVDQRIVSASSPATSRVELHEVVADDDGTMAMRPVAGGLVVPAGGSLTLEPGGYHLMFMGVTSALKPGGRVPVTLRLADGSTVRLSAVVKEFSGADETYQSGQDGMSGMDGM